jgi:hypothetical protein
MGAQDENKSEECEICAAAYERTILSIEAERDRLRHHIAALETFAAIDKHVPVTAMEYRCMAEALMESRTETEALRATIRSKDIAEAKLESELKAVEKLLDLTKLEWKKCAERGGCELGVHVTRNDREGPVW